MKPITFSPQSVDDLREIWRYSIREWGRDQADKYVTEIVTCVMHVHENQRFLQRCDDVMRGYSRIKSGSHILFLKRRTRELVVILIFHQSMDFRRHL
jgi:toxin ParE1/3/4